MTWTRAGLKLSAKGNLSHNYWGCVGVYVLTALVLGAGAATSGILIGIAILFVGLVFQVGLNQYYLHNREQKAKLDDLWSTTSGNQGNVILTMFLMQLFICLWSLLFVIPGIIKTYEYCMVPFLLADNPGMNRKEAFARSKAMTDGMKMDIFVLQLSFIGWHLLSVCTCGLLSILYVGEYQQATMAELYLTLKSRA